MNNTFTSIRNDLLSLGFGFYGEIPKQPADPEKTILRTLPLFFEDRKVFRMLIAWALQTHDLIHLERLISLSDSTSLDPQHKLVLGALSLKIMKRSRRWKTPYIHMKKFQKTTQSHLTIPEDYDDPYLIEKHGEDVEFKEFGIRIATLAPAEPKKLRPLEFILRQNRWLRLRALFGPNFRADLVFLISGALVENPFQAARFLGCSYETTHRLWNQLQPLLVAESLKF